MQPIMLLGEIVGRRPQRSTRLFGKRERQGSVRRGTHCGCWRSDCRSPVLLVRVSYEDEGSGTMVLDTAVFCFFFFFRVRFGSKEKFHFLSNFFFRKLETFIPCSFQLHARKTAHNETALFWGIERGTYMNLHLQTVQDQYRWWKKIVCTYEN